MAWLLEKRTDARPQSAEQVLEYLAQIDAQLEATAITPATQTEETASPDLRALYRDLTGPTSLPRPKDAAGLMATTTRRDDDVIR